MPEKGIKTKYIFLSVNHNITPRKEEILPFCPQHPFGYVALSSGMTPLQIQASYLGQDLAVFFATPK